MSIDGFASQYHSGVGDFDSKAERLLAEKVIIDGTDTDTFVIRKNQNGDEVFVVDTTNSTATLTGDLSVTGNASFTSTANFAVADNLISMASGNTGGDLLDIGFYGTYNDGTTKYAGLFRDQSDANKTWKLIQGITVEPGAGSNFPADVSGNKASLLCGDITGDNITSTAQVLGASGSATAPGLSFSADPNTGIYNSTDLIGFTTNGTSRMNIDSSGSLNLTSGFMTIGVDDNTAGALWLRGDATGGGGLIRIYNSADEDGSVNFWEITADNILRFKQDTTTTMSLDTSQLTLSGRSLTIDNTASEAVIVRKVGDTGDVFVVNTSTSIVYMDTGSVTNNLTVSGNVGIGTTGPDFSLEVGDAGGTFYSSAYTTNMKSAIASSMGTNDWSVETGNSTHRAQLLLVSTQDMSNASNSDMAGVIGFGGNNGGNVPMYAQIGGKYLGQYEGGMIFRTMDTGNMKTAMTIDNAQQVGIGTTNPTTPLYIENGSSGGHLLLRSRQASGTSNDYTGLYFSLADDTVTSGSATYTKGGIFFQDDASGNGIGHMYFCIDNTADASVVTTADSIMTLTNDGNVGIGTTTPYSILEAPGNISCGQWSLTGTHGFGITDVNGAILAGMEFETTSVPSNYSQKVNFYSHRAGVGKQFAMTIDESQNVGIGTTAPAVSLEVYDASTTQLRLTQDLGVDYCDFQVGSSGDINILPRGSICRINTSNASSTVLEVGGEDTKQGFVKIYGGTGSGNGGRLRIFNSAGDDPVDTGTDYWELGANGDSLSFVQGSGGFTKMTLNSSGQLGINKTPSEALDVSGNAVISGTLTVGGASVLTQSTGSWSGGVTTSWSCVLANQSVTVKWTKTGNVVHLNIATMTTAADNTGSNPTNMIIESLPADIKPTTLVANTSLIRTTSGGVIRSGSASIDPTNSWIAITYDSNDVTADWDNSTGSTVGFYQSCISYTLD